MGDIHISIDFGDAQTSKGKLTKVKGSPVRDPEPDNGPGIFDIRPLTSPMVCLSRCRYEHSCLHCCHSSGMICPIYRNPPICCGYGNPSVYNTAWGATAINEKERKKEAEEMKLKLEKEKEARMGREALEFLREKWKLEKESARLDNETKTHKQKKTDWRKKFEALNLD